MLNLPPPNPLTCVAIRCARCRYPEPKNERGWAGDYRCPLCGYDVVEEKMAFKEKESEHV